MDVAIVGIGCRLPGGADTPAAFWDLLCSGVDAVTEVPGDRFDADALYDPDPHKSGTLTSRWGGFVAALDTFDADFFGISPREARRVDPQQRLLLETTWEALEDGGQAADALGGSDAGVFIGASTQDYGDLQRGNGGAIDAYVGTGSALSILANRISYVLDLHGPSLVVDTACSSSLTATHLAFRSLASGECDLAIAGGVNAILVPESTMMFSKASMLAPDGRCKPFDARADGYVRSEGAAVVVLKALDRALDDADPIYAVIRGTAVNEDGRTAGLTVPNPDAQARLLRRALAEAGVSPADVDYVEAHGTGTAVGDPLEATAIGAVYGAGRPADRPCLIGSVKGNVGHLEAAAGVTGLIKAALVLHHRRIPPSLHFRQGNPAIDFDGLRLRVPRDLEPWPGPPGAALAAVNAFGFGGANAHAILAGAPDRAAAPPDDEVTSRLLPLSARSPAALESLARRWADALTAPDGPSLRDASHTAAMRRSHLPHRLVVEAIGAREAAGRLEAFLAGEPDPGLATGRAPAGEPPRLAFVFAGMGPQWPGMAQTLLRDEPVFRAALQACDEILVPLAGWSAVDALLEGDRRVGDADRSHVANFTLQVGLAALWERWGVVPDAVVGHSSGETAAAYVAGALSLGDALRLAHHRGRLLHTRSGAGGMLAAAVGPEEAQRLATEFAGVAVAAVNGPSSVTFSGDGDGLAALAAALVAEGRWHRELAVRIPYHSPQLDPLEDDLFAALDGLAAGPVRIPIVSSTTGQWIDGEAFTPDHWWRNLRQPVRFADAVDRLADAGCELFVELGPHPVLAQSVLECLAAGDHDGVVVPSLRRNEDERRTMLRATAALHVRGRPPDWRAVTRGEGRHARLPAYPWQRERHWFDARPRARSGAVAAWTGVEHPLLGARMRVARPTWALDLADPRLDYLEGHAVAGSPAFPGAGYVALALTAAQRDAGTPTALDRMTFHDLLRVDVRDGVTLHTTLDEESGVVAVHSSGADDRWVLRASARVTEVTTEPPVDLTAIRRRCTRTLEPERFYTAAEEHFGLRYRDAFRVAGEFHVGVGEALARVEVPEEAWQPVDGGAVHPPMLDAAFHAMLAPRIADRDAPKPRGAAVPVAIDTVTWHAPPGRRCWSHATLHRREDGTLTGDVRLVDEDGTVLLTCRGVRLQELRRPDTSPYLSEEVWEPAPRRRAAAPSPIAHRISARLGRLAAETGFTDYYDVVEPALNTLALGLVHDAFTELGWRPDEHPEVSLEQLGVVPRHHRYAARLLELLTARAGAGGAAGAVLAGRGDVRPGMELVTGTGRRLAVTLRGEEDPRSWLLAGEAADALAAFYGATPSGDFYNRALAEAVAEVTPADRGLRILEVGAGTGATTAALLRSLDAVDSYRVTDVSPFFVKHARRRFGDHPGTSFATLDLEQEPESGEGYDVVVGADVIHATADVRTTLRRLAGLLVPGGLLVLLEPVRRSPWLELIFGQVEGWWTFADADLRPEHPLMTAAAWEEVLAGTGYADVAHIADEPPDGGAPMQVLLLARTPGDARPAVAPPRRWLVLADGDGVGERIAAALRGRGDDCTVVHPGAAYGNGGDHVQVDPGDEAHWRRLLDVTDGADPSAVGLVHCWGLDAPAHHVDADTVMATADITCGGLITLLRAAQAAGVALGDVWVITAGAQRATAQDPPGAPAQALLWGLGRVLRNERGGGRCHLVDLGRAGDADDVEALLEEVDASVGDDAEPEVALRRGRRYTRRLRTPRFGPVPRRRRRRSPDDARVRLAVGVPGALDTLHLRASEPSQPRPGEVLLRVRAASLNFRDILVAHGLLPGSQRKQVLGLDCAGIIVAAEGTDTYRPGDEVIAIGSGALGSQLTVPAALCARKPPDLSFEAAAALPTAFVTAYLALCDLGRLAAGERVLLHTASGGVGLAALQLARRAGAVVFATAGTPEKRAVVVAGGAERVLDSRSLAFADEVREATGGEGVDVVVNTLIGRARTASLALLRPGGRFIDLSVRDFATEEVGLAPFGRGLSFHSLGDPEDPLPTAWGDILRSVVGDVAAGRLTPLRHETYDLAEATEAFRLLAQARHIGKVVLRVEEPHYWVDEPPPPLFTADATYLLVGGLGGLGLALARWMVGQGARHLVLTSRRGAPGPEDEAAFRELTTSGAAVTTAAVDAADREAMQILLANIRTGGPPLRGVVHAAMVLDDEWLGRLDRERARAVLAPKVAGGWNLHELTLDDDLDLFLCFSSASSLIGTPMQGAYAAANAFLDALAEHRSARGLPALTVNWGAVSGVGYVARHPELWEVSARAGITAITPDEAFAGLETALRHPVSRLAIGRVDWRSWALGGAPAPGDATSRHATRRPAGEKGAAGDGAGAVPAPPGDGPADVEAHVVRRAAAVLDTAPARIDRDTPLADLGLDSLMAVELQAMLQRDFGVEIPLADVLDGASARALARRLDARTADAPTSERTTAPRGGRSRP